VTTKIQIRRDTTINWNTNDPILLLGEVGIDTTTWNFKFGDGVSKFSELEYFNLDAEFTRRKLSSVGDFTGTWNGLPMQSSEVGLASDWNSAKGTFPTVTQRLDNSDFVKADIANMFYPNNAYGGIVSSNFNTIATSGFYTGYGTATGAPNMSSSWYIQHINSNVGTASAYQVAKSYTTIEVYMRVKTTSTWGSWLPYPAQYVGIADTMGYYTATDVENALAEVYTTKASITNVANYLKNVSPIYGVLWDKSSSPTLTRTDASIGMVANIGVGSAVVRNDFDSATIYREITTVTDTLGNSFVRIPKFYIKKTDATAYKQWQICKYQQTGFYLPKCFWDYTNSKELDYIDVGKYPASISGTVLQSVSGAFPLVNTNIVNMRSYATANNTGGLLGYQQLDIHVIDVLRTLFFIEFATLNSQAIMPGFSNGKYVPTDTATAAGSSTNRIIVTNAIGATYAVGQTIGIGTALGGGQIASNRVVQSITVDTPSAGSTAIVFDGSAVTVTTGNILYNTAWKNGFSSGITASSGVITANTDKYPMSYRGIENIYGNIYQFVDGVNITANQSWVCANAAQYASNVFASPYEVLSYANGNTNGYVSAMGYDSGHLYSEFPTAVAGSATTYYSDYYYQSTSTYIASFGGLWNDGSSDGISYWDLTHSSSFTGINFGGRLLKKPL
jgi:hypothetical protein